MTHKGKLIFNGKELQVEVVDGIRYIDGKTIDEFMETLDEGDLKLFAGIGKRKLGIKP